MDRLALHIEYLLLRHDCVVVPDFGAFIKVRHAASTSSESGIIKPMTQEVRFNGALRHDDGMLASSYARREHLSYGEARDTVRQAVTLLSDTLRTDREATIGRLGLITLDEEDNHLFTPAWAPDTLAARLGFYPTTINRTTAAAGIAPAPATQHTATETKPPQTSPRFDTARNYYIPVNRRMVRYAASLIAVFAVALSAILPFTTDTHEDQASIVPVKTIVKAVREAAPAPVTEIPTAQEEKASEPENTWHLIVGTFHSQQEADNFIAANSDKGYSLSTVASRNLYRVSACDAADKATLLPELNSAEFQQKFQQAWIFNSAN